VYFLEDEPLRQHRIEQLLLEAHLERQTGIDLIEDYFAVESSLDPITRYAAKLLNERDDPTDREVIVKNLAECIVVKMQRDQRGVRGKMRRFLSRFVDIGKSPEVVRAEVLIKNHHQYS
jgi:hypothetical protein